MNVRLIKLYNILLIIIFVAQFLCCKRADNSLKIKEKKSVIESSKTSQNTVKILDKDYSDTIFKKKYRINDSTTIEVTDDKIKVYINNKIFSENSNILNSKDHKNCIAEGFKKLVFKDKYFTVEKQSCSNKYFIEEYITFKLVKENNQILLHALGYSYTNRLNPDEKLPNKTFKIEDFGKIKFEKVDSNRLYVQMINKP